MTQIPLSFQVPELAFEPITCDVTLSVWAALRSHVGRGQAITSREIARALDLNRARVRQACHDLIVLHGKPIGSGGEGYWITVNEDERRSTCAHLVSRLRKIALHLRAYDSNAARAALLQLHAELFGESSA